MRAAELVGTAQAERRVLRLTNPNLPGIASNTLVANIQIVMPGEIARAHRHSGAALRLIIEGRGGYTVVNGERVPMSPGDLVLTPNWSWHDHANDTDAPMIWLDGLDTPMPASMKSTTRRGKILVRLSMPRSGTTRCRRCGPPYNGWLLPIPATPVRGSSSNTPTGGPADR
jgi:gentisate 1,2-dioxygenase